MAKPVGHGGIDYPDWIQGTTPHSNPVEITNAELAIRLGFPQVFERTGNVLFYEGFQYGLGDWNPHQNPAANKPLLSAIGLLNSPYSAKLVSDGTQFGFSTIRKDLGYPYLTTFGMEFSFKPSTEISQLRFGIIVFTGDTKWSIWGQYDDSTYKWSVLDNTPAYQDVLTYNIGAFDHSNWHTVKVVADLVNGLYARLMVDNEDVGISSYVPRNDVDVTDPYIYLGVDIFNTGTKVYDVYVDNVILTINEPT
jgi:hypothetical protein